MNWDGTGFLVYLRTEFLVRRRQMRGLWECLTSQLCLAHSQARSCRDRLAKRLSTAGCIGKPRER